MKILVQWATDPPGDWQEIESRDWTALPKKPEPPVDRSPIYDDNEAVMGFIGTGVVIDDQPGWVNRVCVQGVSFFGDHIAVLHYPDEKFIEIYCWNDDLGDYLPEELYASIWRFYPLLTKPILNTRQHCTRFIHSSLLNDAPKMETTGGLVQYQDYDDFVIPDDSLVRHGIWMTDVLNNELRAFAPMGWRRWL